MAGYNRVVIMGNLTRDPEYKQIASGQPLCRLGLATNRQFRNRQSGAMVQEVCFIDIDVWGAQAESCRQYLQKGRSVLIEGRLKLDSWTDQEGKNRSKHTIVADRVVFVGSSNAVGDDVEMGAEADNSSIGAARLDTSDMVMDPALSKQINEVRARTEAKTKARNAVPPAPQSAIDDQGMDGFKDEAPFKDELPF